jgi:hypothetical protein
LRDQGLDLKIHKGFINKTLNATSLARVYERNRLTEKAFQKFLLEAVDSAFSSLGDSARHSIYYHLQNKFNVSRDEIPCRLEDFEDGLEKIFGAGTQFLEVLIMRELYERLRPEGNILEWDEEKEFSFVDYVKAAEQNYSRGKGRRTKAL